MRSQLSQEEMFGPRVARYGGRSSRRRPPLKTIILDRLQDSSVGGGLTVDELERLTGRPHQSVSARVHELESVGVLYSCGMRQTRSGRWASVWATVPGHAGPA